METSHYSVRRLAFIVLNKDNWANLLVKILL